MADSLIDKNVLNEAIELGQVMSGPQGNGLEIPYAVIPTGHSLASLIQHKYPYGLPPRKPDHIESIVNMKDAESFCKYVKLYADSRTRIFADPKELTFRAVLDYHGAPQTALPPSPDVSAPGPLLASPEFKSHQATLALKTSEQWNIWIGKNEKVTPQAEFAEFLEDNCMDIVDPEPAKMLQYARELTAKIDVNFASKVNARNGSVQFAYQEVVTQGAVGEAGNLVMPEEFSILIPVFFGENPTMIRARLRFRITSSKLHFFYKLYRPAEVLATGFQQSVKAISDTLAMDVLLGSV